MGDDVDSSRLRPFLSSLGKIGGVSKIVQSPRAIYTYATEKVRDEKCLICHYVSLAPSLTKSWIDLYVFFFMQMIEQINGLKLKNLQTETHTTT